MKKQWQILGVDGVKASLLWDEDTDAWTYYTNDPRNREPQLYRTIPVFYRGVEIVRNSVAKVPFALYRGEEEAATSSSWEDPTGYIPSPRRFLRLTCSALDRHGRAYWLKKPNAAGFIKGLKWLAPTSIEPQFDEQTGELTGFLRTMQSGQIMYKPDALLYFWLEDDDVELGPPLAYPAKSAMQSAGVLHNLDEFINAYFKSGAVRPMMLMTKGFPHEDEKNRIKAWWRGLTGLKHSREVGIFSADSIEPKQIGDGLDQLQNQELTEDQRKDVALALGIPQTILFANAANYATNKGDWLNFHETTIIPRCEFIAEVLNNQLLEAEGLEWRFMPEGLDIYREDENARAGALVQYVNAGYPLLMASDLLGIDLTPEQRAQLEKAAVEKEERADEMAENMQGQPEPEDDEENEQPPQLQQAKAIDPAEITAELKHWRRLCNKALRENKPMPCDFVPDHIPPGRASAIAECLKAVKTGADIKAAFEAEAAIPLPADWPLPADLLAELKRANDLLESVKG